MYRIRNRKAFNEYILRQTAKYKNIHQIKAVIIDDITGYKYYLVNYDELNDEYSVLIMDEKIFVSYKRIDKLEMMSTDIFTVILPSNYYVDSNNKYLGQNYMKVVNDFKTKIEEVNKNGFKLY